MAIMLSSLRANLTQQQKARIKYSIAILSTTNLKSIVATKKFTFSYKVLFQKLRPVVTNMELLRVGGNLDGSYLVPRSQYAYDGVVSPGVGQTFEFESEIMGNECRVVLIDGTVDEPVNLPKNFIFLSKMLGTSSDLKDSFISLKSVTKDYFPLANSLVLQMDIEGGEYGVLNSLEADALAPYSLVLVEFHQFHKLQESRLWNSAIEGAIKALEKDFLLVHTHPNNAGGFFVWKFRKMPKVVETTWVKKSKVSAVHGFAKLPHPLDRRNDTMIEDLAFPAFQNL